MITIDSIDDYDSIIELEMSLDEILEALPESPVNFVTTDGANYYLFKVSDGHYAIQDNKDGHFFVIAGKDLDKAFPNLEDMTEILGLPKETYH